MLPAIDGNPRSGRYTHGRCDRDAHALRRTVQNGRDRLELNGANRTVWNRRRRRTPGSAPAPAATIGRNTRVRLGTARIGSFGVFFGRSRRLGSAAALFRPAARIMLRLGLSHRCTGRGARHHAVRARDPAAQLHDERAQQGQHHRQGWNRTPQHVCSIRCRRGRFSRKSPFSTANIFGTGPKTPDRSRTIGDRSARTPTLPTDRRAQGCLAFISSSCSWYPWIWARRSSA